MKNKIFVILVCLLFALSGCKGDENLDEKVLPGKLAGISYDKISGMVANADYHISVDPKSFSAEFWPEDIEDFIFDPESESYIPCVSNDVPITEEQWNEIEKAALLIYQKTEPKKASGGFFEKLLKDFIKSKTTVADDADMITLTFYWETESGTVSEKCNIPDTEESKTLINLLKSLTETI